MDGYTKSTEEVEWGKRSFYSTLSLQNGYANSFVVPKKVAALYCPSSQNSVKKKNLPGYG